MGKVLFISGSPRKGNTEFILKRIFDSFDREKELLLLREKNIKHCYGCLTCDKTKQCAIQDDMQGIYEKMIEADILVIGSPNYFDNVPGLLKDFIDRTNPFYETDKLKGKKLLTLIVGGGEKENSEKVVNYALKSFAKCHNLDIVGFYCFQALKPNEAENNPAVLQFISEISQKIQEIVEKYFF